MITVLKRENDALALLVEQLRNELHQVRQDNSSLKSEYVEAERSLRSEKQNMEEAVQMMRAKLRDMTGGSSAKRQMQEQLSTTEKENSLLQKRVSELEFQVMELKAKLTMAVMEATTRDMKQQMENDRSMEDQQQKQQTEIEYYVKLVEVHERRVMDLQTVNERLIQEVESSREENEQLSQSLSEMTVKIEELTKMNKSVREQQQQQSQQPSKKPLRSLSMTRLKSFSTKKDKSHTGCSSPVPSKISSPKVSEKSTSDEEFEPYVDDEIEQEFTAGASSLMKEPVEEPRIGVTIVRQRSMDRNRQRSKSDFGFYGKDRHSNNYNNDDDEYANIENRIQYGSPKDLDNASNVVISSIRQNSFRRLKDSSRNGTPTRVSSGERHVVFSDTVEDIALTLDQRAEQRKVPVPVPVAPTKKLGRSMSLRKAESILPRIA